MVPFVSLPSHSGSEDHVQDEVLDHYSRPTASDSVCANVTDTPDAR